MAGYTNTHTRKGKWGDRLNAKVYREHAKRRLWKRYGIPPTDQLIQLIELRIITGAGNTWRLYKQYWARSVWRVALQNQVFYVVFDEYLKCVTTFLTREWILKNHPKAVV